MRLYLDVCAIQRPLDDPDQLRIRLEAEAVRSLLAAVQMGSLALVASDVHLLEIRRNPHAKRRAFAMRVLELAPEIVPFTEKAAALARTFAAVNIKGPDALHLAVAMRVGADRFCTTDDRLLRRGHRVDTGALALVTPLDLATELDLS